jgi:polyphosphate:AMP phosphotransferase
MLESAEIGHSIDKKVYAREEVRLREALLNAQFELSEKGRGPVLVIISGVESGGRGETANLLTTWMDPRHIRVHAFGPRTPDELARPVAWRYWRALPPTGKIGIFMNAWYREALVEHLTGGVDDAALDVYLQNIRHHERMLSYEGIVLAKFWIHLSREAQKRRIAELESDPQTRWRITAEDKRALKIYGKSHGFWEHVLRESSTGMAPWYVVEGADERYRSLTIGKILLDVLGQTLAAPPARRAPVKSTLPAPAVVDNVKLIRELDLDHRLTNKEYASGVAKYQRRLAKLSRDRRFAERALVAVFEGADAAGKGGAIRRVSGALDARRYTIIPVAAPTDEERVHPYLWRFWRHLPPRGGITIFDRSWYGRVLVERVQGFCSIDDWTRAYDEINQFEEQLVRAGIIVVKFWLQISKDEQLARFRARETTAFKRFKITREDWRNRRRWGDYERAVCDMVDRTSTELAPWTLVEANDKRYARVKVLKTLVSRLQDAFD